jgi:hypothetical protein
MKISDLNGSAPTGGKTPYSENTSLLIKAGNRSNIKSYLEIELTRLGSMLMISRGRYFLQCDGHDIVDLADYN